MTDESKRMVPRYPKREWRGGDTHESARQRLRRMDASVGDVSIEDAIRVCRAHGWHVLSEEERRGLDRRIAHLHERYGAEKRAAYLDAHRAESQLSLAMTWGRELVRRIDDEATAVDADQRVIDRLIDRRDEADAAYHRVLYRLGLAQARLTEALAMVERCAREVPEAVTRKAILADLGALREEVER